MMNFAKYERYKDSGVEWLGEIPEHWNITRMSNFGFFSKGQGISKSQVSEIGLPALLYGEIYTKYEIRVSQLITHVSEGVAKNSEKIYRNDLCFTASGETIEDIGKCVLYDGNETAYAGGDVIIFRQKQENSLYLSYLFNSYSFEEQKARLSKGEIVVHIYPSKLKTIKFCLPPIAEQERIAEFLDRKCGEIDEAIAKKQRLIELLDEQKTILINQAVTKGLNPDAPMKDSGIDWLGQIPAHWRIEKVKHVFNFVGGVTPSKEKQEFWDGNVNWFSPKDMKQRYLYKSSMFITQEALKQTRISVLPVDTILIVVRGMILAKKIPVALIKNEGTINQDMKGLNLKDKKGCPDYFLLLMEGINYAISPLLEEAGHGTKTLPTVNFSQLQIPIPPISEQVSIANFINHSESEIEQVLKGVKEQISKLQELKQVLIAEAVTGKIKV